MEQEVFPSVFAVFDYLKSKGWGGLYRKRPKTDLVI